jgi:hypothetical protein
VVELADGSTERVPVARNVFAVIDQTRVNATVSHERATETPR